jgi:hypothetical protein
MITDEYGQPLYEEVIEMTDDGTIEDTTKYDNIRLVILGKGDNHG